MRVLGVSVNSRIVSTAIVEDKALIDYQNRLYSERWSPMKAKKIVFLIKYSIKYCAITNIALAIPYAHYQNKETKTLITLIKTECQKKNVPISCYSPEAFGCLYEKTKANKKALMSALAERYPELGYIRKKELRNKREYYHKVFTAVASALLCNIEHSRNQ